TLPRSSLGRPLLSPSRMRTRRVRRSSCLCQQLAQVSQAFDSRWFVWFARIALARALFGALCVCAARDWQAFGHPQLLFIACQDGDQDGRVRLLSLPTTHASFPAVRSAVVRMA